MLKCRKHAQRWLSQSFQLAKSPKKVVAKKDPFKKTTVSTTLASFNYNKGLTIQEYVRINELFRQSHTKSLSMSQNREAMKIKSKRDAFNYKICLDMFTDTFPDLKSKVSNAKSMTDVNILLKEYINHTARANAGLMAGTTKKLSKMRFEKTGSMKGATKFQDKVQRSKAEKAYERVQYYPDSHQKISDRGFDFTMNTQYLNYLRDRTTKRLSYFAMFGLVFSATLFFALTQRNRHSNGAGHNLIRQSLFDLEATGICENMNYKLETSNIPNVLGRLFPSFNTLFNGLIWDWDSSNQRVELAYEILLRKKDEENNSKGYPARIHLIAEVDPDEVQTNSLKEHEFNFFEDNQIVFLYTCVFWVLLLTFALRTKQTSNKRPNALLKLIQNLSIRGYYRSTYLFPSLFLGGCVTGLNDSIASGLLKKYYAFQMESDLANNSEDSEQNDDEVRVPRGINRPTGLRGLMIDGLEMIIDPLDNSFETLSRHSKWNIQSMLISFMSEDNQKMIWIKKPSNLQDSQE